MLLCSKLYYYENKTFTAYCHFNYLSYSDATGLNLKLNNSTPPFIIDSHMHYTATDEWEKSFLDVFTSHNAMACLLMPMKDLDRGIAFAKAHPDRVIPYAEINIDSPTVVEDIQKVHSMGFRGLGELFAMGRRDYNDPKYDTIWALAEQLGMPIAPHTGILFDGTMANLRPSFIADVAARHPNLVNPCCTFRKSMV